MICDNCKYKDYCEEKVPSSACMIIAMIKQAEDQKEIK